LIVKEHSRWTVGTVDGILTLHEGEEAIEVSISYADRHEVVAGQTLSSPTLTVLDSDGDVTTDLVIASGPTVSGTSVNFTITVDSAAVVGAEYEIKCQVTLSGGGRPIECLGVVIEKC
jgi:hypothetical protein